MRKGMSRKDTAIYIQMLELLCENQQLLGEANAELIGSLKEEIENQEQTIFKLRRIQELQAEQLEKMQELIGIYEEKVGNRVMKWLRKVRKKDAP